MFRFVKRLVGAEVPVSQTAPPFESPGVLYWIPNPENNYMKNCLMQQAIVSVASDHITLVNQMYDPDQGSADTVSFAVRVDMEMSMYQIVDDEQYVYGFKFLNTEEQPIYPRAKIIAIEFDDEDTANAFQASLNFILHSQVHPNAAYDPERADAYVQYEGLQRPEESEKRGWRERAELVKTVANVKEPESVRREESGHAAYPDLEGSDEEDFPEIPQIEQEKAKQLQFARVAIQELSHLYSLPQILFMSPSHLYELDSSTREYKLIAVNLAFVFVRLQPQQYSLDLIQSGNPILKNQIRKDFAFEIDPGEARFRWRQKQRVWECVLADDVKKLPPLIARALVECEYQQDLEEVFPDVSDQQYVLGEGDASLTSIIASSGEEEQALGTWSEGANLGFLEGDKITDSAQGYSGSLIFATRQNRVDVLKCEESGFRHLDAGFGPLFNRENQSVEATRLLVNQQDTKALLYGTANPKSVYYTDLERGQIVEEWKMQTPITQIATVFKFAETTPETKVLAIGPEAILELDPRLSSQSKVAREKTYKSAMDFTCVTTTTDGGFAVGNSKGEIRLYKETGQIAKTQLPGLGKKLTSLDVTTDGTWVLGTSKTCLMLVPVLSHGKNGFIARLGPDKRPITSFSISLEDQSALHITDLDFTPARFNSSPQGPETSIVTSTGPYVVTWDFEKLKKRLKTKNFKNCYTKISRSEASSGLEAIGNNW